MIKLGDILFSIETIDNWLWSRSGFSEDDRRLVMLSSYNKHGIIVISN